MYISSKYLLLVSLITNKRYQPWKNNIGSTLIKMSSDKV